MERDLGSFCYGELLNVLRSLFTVTCAMGRSRLPAISRRRNPKSEIRSPKEVRKSKSEKSTGCGLVRSSDFFRPSDFGFRPSRWSDLRNHPNFTLRVPLGSGVGARSMICRMRANHQWARAWRGVRRHERGFGRLSSSCRSFIVFIFGRILKQPVGHPPSKEKKCF